MLPFEMFPTICLASILFIYRFRPKRPCVAFTAGNVYFGFECVILILFRSHNVKGVISSENHK